MSQAIIRKITWIFNCIEIIIDTTQNSDNTDCDSGSKKDRNQATLSYDIAKSRFAKKENIFPSHKRTVFYSGRGG